MQVKNYFKPLTGVRAVAAYLVYFHHTRPLFLPVDNLLNKLLGFFFSELHIGVSLFFVLSGFLITHRYWNQTLLTKKALKTYLINRFARIFPIYFLLTCCTFFFFTRNRELSAEVVRSFLLNITLLRGFSHKYLFSGIAQGWSLTVEETFYLSAPFLFYFGRKMRIKAQVFTILLYVVSFMLVGLLLTSVLSRSGGHFLEDYSLMLHYTFFGRAFEFAVGIGLSLLLMHHKHLNTNRTGASYSTYIGIGGIILVVFFQMLLQHHRPFRFGFEHPIGLVLNNYVLPFFIAILFYGLMYEKTRVSQVLSTPLFDILGKSSYSFYLLHMGLLYNAVSARIQPNSVYGYICNFIIIQIAAVICYFVIEEPANKFIRSLNSEKITS